MRIKIKDDETIEEFADWFYYDAQILMGCSALLTYDAKTVLKYALEPYPALSIAMVQPLVNKCTIPDMIEILKRTGINMGSATLVTGQAMLNTQNSIILTVFQKVLILLKNLNNSTVIEVKITLV